MKVLTDTHSLVWGLGNRSKLSIKALDTLANEQIVASVVNLWELILKKDKPDALIAEPVAWWDKYVVRTGVPVLGIRPAHVMMLDQLPGFHKDPFDRMLIAQAIVEKASLLSKDSVLTAYPVAVIW